MKNQIKRLKDNLTIIRKAAGWSAESLGEKIGVTRQTINNIEAGKQELSQAQYMAIRYVLDKEILNNQDDTKMLAKLIDMLIDNPDKYDPDKKTELVDEAEYIVPSINKGKSRKEVSDRWIKIAGNILLGGVVGGLVGLSIADVIKKINKK